MTALGPKVTSPAKETCIADLDGSREYVIPVRTKGATARKTRTPIEIFFILFTPAFIYKFDLQKKQLQLKVRKLFI